MVLEQNTRYKATVRLSFLESIATNDIIAGKITTAGFTDVVVGGAGSTRTVHGTWPKATQEVKNIPTQLQNIQKL